MNVSRRKVEGTHGNGMKRQKRKIIGSDLLGSSPLAQGKSKSSSTNGAQRSQVQSSQGGGLLGGVLGGAGGVGI